MRQYTPEGAFKAFENHLQRLKDMGVSILWIMPINPIGEKNRKGTLGSEYSVKDYYAINPEFGSMDDFKHLVNKIHDMGMHVIVDWVANHSAWDNPLVKQHPEWYIKNREGNFEPTPWRDYDDIIDFDYDQPGLRKYMTNALKYWVKEANINGYRCDVASFVPLDFWENARAELSRMKPVFMLAEATDRDLHKRAFDMTYSWSLWDNLHAITVNHASVSGLTEGYIAENVSIWPKDAYRMNFIENHDKNSWEGTQYTNFGKGLNAAIVLTATIDGMPLIYSGQEAGLNRSLNFFERDPIQWKQDTIGQIYTKLFHLKHDNQALWNGKWGGEMERIKNDNMKQVIAFAREKNGDKVITIVNLSDKAVSVKLDTQYDKGAYTELFTNAKVALKGDDKLSLQPWSYMVLVK
ncbi:MAG TPA: alpha-amylase family glycosyl hydrolase [Flavisolibacter sp.]|nr:alpha-amylase family glycosyl hydrolase [Flavisolibacter sp.]